MSEQRIRKDITKLILYLESSIVKLLKSHNLITRGSKNLRSAELTPEAMVLIGEDDELVTEEWIQEWRKLWPKGQRGDMGVIRKKLNRFLQEEDVTLKEISRATEAYIAAQSNPKYAGTANNFFYKQDNEQGGVISRCQQWIEDIDEDNEVSFGNELLD